jgi:gliding motility-associated-like protein
MKMKYLYISFLLLVLKVPVLLVGQDYVLPVSADLVMHNLSFDDQGEVRIQLRGLVPGDRYEFHIVQDRRNPPVAFSTILPERSATSGVSSLHGIAQAGVVSFCLDAIAPSIKQIAVGVMKNRKAPPPGDPTKMAGDTIEVEETNDIDYLLNTVFRQDTCFALFPGSIQGGRRPRFDGTFFGQTGIFRNGLPSVGIDSGIIVTSGYVQDAPGPNTPTASQNAPVDFFTTYNGTDVDADALVPDDVDIYDLVIMDFDFIPTTDTISFNYVFFSEQYCANLSGNVSADAFGFILTAPDGSTQNIARLPISGDIVSPTTLNPSTPDAAFFLNNTTAAFGNPCMDTPPPASRLNGIGYDGFSTVLTARGPVIPCAPHNLKIIVLDADDALSDSGVLLEAGSFLASLVNKPEPTTTSEIDRLTPVEGCDNALIKFTRRTLDATALSRPLLVKYSIVPIINGAFNEATRATDPTNTAGADYLLPVSPFVIPAGDTSATLTIPILDDLDFNEGLEAFIIRYDGTCNCSENADTFYIQDNVGMELDLGPDRTACADSELILTATPIGGNGTYTFVWPDGQDTSRVTFVSTGQDTTIIVNVTDGCGLMGTDTLRILPPSTSAATGGFFALCNNETADVVIDVEGTDRYTIVLRVDSNNVVTDTEYVITGDTTFVFRTNADISVLSVEDDSGCGGAVNGLARVRTPDVELVATLTPASCNQLIGGISLVTADGNSNFTFSWLDDVNQTGATRTGLAPGTYEVSIGRSGASCPQTRTFTLAATAALTISGFNLTPVTCAGEAVTVAPVVVGGNPPYTFSWPDSMTTDSLLEVTTIFGEQRYPVIVTDSCGATMTDTLSIDLPLFTASTGGRYSLCNAPLVEVPVSITGPAGNYQLEVRIDSVGTIISRTFTTSPGLFILDFDHAASITVTGLTSSDGCAGRVGTDTAFIIDPQLRFDVAVTDIRCEGESTGAITLTDASTVSITYSWSDGGPDSAIRTNLPAGDYGITLTDATDSSCMRDTVISIAEPNVLVLSVSGVGMASCQGETVDLFPIVSGGALPYTFDWDNGASMDSLYTLTTVGGTTVYPVLVTDACGVAVRDTVTISVSDTRAELSGNFSVCNAPFNANVPITFTGAGPFTYTIAENGVARTLVLSNGLDTLLNYTSATTIQLLSVTGADGCAGTAGGIAEVTDGDFRVTALTEDIRCAGAITGSIVVDVNGNNNAYRFDWDQAGLSGSDVTGLASGTYRLTVTDLTPNGCTWDSVFVLIEPSTAMALVRDSVRQESCRSLAFASATYAGGTGNLTYTWSNGTTGPVLGEVPAGLYSLSVSDGNGCEVIQPFNLTDQRSTVQASILQSAAELSCSQPSLDLTAAQNAQIVGWAWRDAAGNLLGNLRRITVSTAGRYYVTITNPANACFATDSVDVIANDEFLSLELAPEARITCSDAAIDFAVIASGFSGTPTYEWTFAGGVVGTTSGLSDITTPGTYQVRVSRPDNGCEAFASIAVRIDQDPPVVSVPTPVTTVSCREPETELAVIANGPYRLAWTTTNGNISSDPTGSAITADRAGTYDVLLTDTLNGCTTTTRLQVITNGATLIANAGTDQPLICNGMGTVLNGAFSPTLSGTSAVWYDPGGLIIADNTQAFTLTEGAHILEVIHPVSGCSRFDTVMVVSEAPTAVTYTLQQPPCPEVGGRLFVNSVSGLNGPFTYSSPTGETEPFGAGLRGLREGSNALVVTDQYGCTLRDTFLIFEGGTFEGTAEDVTIRLGEEAMLGVSTNRLDGALVSWSWANLNDTLACLNCPDPTISPLESMVAQVTIVDSNGCVLTLRQQVIVDEQELIYMPTAFSPNGDGVNDVYRVFGNPDFVDGINWLRIFDRWGSIVYEKLDYDLNDPDAFWDGQAKDGRRYPDAVYVFSVSYRRFDDLTEVRTGGFTLVR